MIGKIKIQQKYFYSGDKGNPSIWDSPYFHDKSFTENVKINKILNVFQIFLPPRKLRKKSVNGIMSTKAKSSAEKVRQTFSSCLHVRKCLPDFLHRAVSPWFGAAKRIRTYTAGAHKGLYPRAAKQIRPHTAIPTRDPSRATNPLGGPPNAPYTSSKCPALSGYIARKRGRCRHSVAESQREMTEHDE